MDKTIIIWNPPEAGIGDSQWEEQVWTERVRLGEMGGNTLGFLGAQFDPSGREGVVGYSFSGAFHGWEEHADGGQWGPTVQIGGHAGQVNDITWEEEGRLGKSIRHPDIEA